MTTSRRSTLDHMHGITSWPRFPSLNRWSEHSQKGEWSPCILQETVHSISRGLYFFFFFLFFFTHPPPAVTQSMVEYEISISQIIVERENKQQPILYLGKIIGIKQLSLSKESMRRNDSAIVNTYFSNNKSRHEQKLKRTNYESSLGGTNDLEQKKFLTNCLCYLVM